MTEADPIEVFRPANRWTFLLRNLFYAVLFIVVAAVQIAGSNPRRPAAATSCHCQGGGSTNIFWLFIVVAVGFTGLAIRLWRTVRVEIYPDGLVMNAGLRSRRYAWRDIANVYLDGGSRVWLPVPRLILADGQVIGLRAMGGQLRLAPRRTDALDDLVEAIRLRIGHPKPPPPPPPTREGLPFRWAAIAVLIVLLEVVVGILLIVFVTLPFAHDDAPVSPSQVPAGRPYFQRDFADGTVDYTVSCPPPIDSVSSNDPICRPDGRHQLIVAGIGIPVTLGLLVLGILALVRIGRRRRTRRPEPYVLDGSAPDRVS
jgi:hypothetical protein